MGLLKRALREENYELAALCLVYGVLKEMYDGFSRTDLNQGLPPPDEKIRHQWIQTLLKSANNFLAFSGLNS